MDNQPQQPQPLMPMSQKPRKKILLAGAISLGILIALAIAFFVIAQLQQQNKENTDKATNATSNKLYDVLGNAAKQASVRVAMYRATYATKADADANKNIGTILSSVSEVGSGKFRSVFVENIVKTPKFSAGRCMDGVEYTDYFEDKNTRPETLSEGVEILKQLHRVTIPPIISPCPSVGIISGSSPDLAVSRLSDGVFPVTLTAPQATNWVAKMKQANLFTVSDDGMVEHSGKQLRKISFTSKDTSATNQRLYDIFIETGEIDKTISEHPEAKWEFSFISVNPNNSGGVGGYYLIDDATNLPVYSELYGTNKDRSEKDHGKTAIRNIARTKQNYIYPSQLTIDLNTPLEFVE